MVIRKRRRQEIGSIAVVGTSKGVGVTHACLTLANYLCSVLGYEVTYIEMRDISNLLPVVKGEEVKVYNTMGYKYQNVNYVFTNSIEQARQILLFAKGVVVVDMEELNILTNEIFAMCDRKVIVGSISPWCFEEYMQFIKTKIHKKHDIKSISLLVKGINRKAKKKFNEYYEGTLIPMPYIENPLLLKGKDLINIKKIIC